MSAYKTIDITETAAKMFVMSKIPLLTNENLERFIDMFLAERLYNCNIVPDGSENDDDILAD